MSVPFARRILPLLAGAAIVSVGGLAVAGGKPAKPPAKPPAPAPAAAAPAGKEPASLAELNDAFDEMAKQAERGVLRQRIAALEAYVKAKPTATDLEQAREALVDVAEQAEDHASVVRFADEFVAAHPKSESRVGVLLQKGSALGDLEKAAEGKAVYEALVAETKDDRQHGGQVQYAYAQFCEKVEDWTAAKEAYEKLKSFVDPRTQQQLDEIIVRIALIGTEPTELPEGTKDMAGKALTFGEYKGKVLLVDFWATWCGPCRREMPNVVKAYRKFHDQGFEIVGISLDNEGDAEVKKIHDFESEKGMTWRQYYDGKGWQNEIAQLYNVHSIPHTLLIGRDGKIARLGATGEELSKKVAKLLAAPATPPEK